MDDDVVAALIAYLRGVAGIAALVAGGIYPAEQVPHDAPFPRGMVGAVDGGTDQWSDGGLHLERQPWFSVEWVTNNVASPTANRDVQALDALAFAALRGITLPVANLTYLRRLRTLRINPQTNDNVEYIAGGGLWVALRQYDFSAP